MDLSSPVTSLPGIGESYANKLAKGLNIKTIKDLLEHYPRNYQDFSQITSISSIKDNQLLTIRGEVKSLDNIYYRHGKSRQQAIIEDKTGQIMVTWFNQPFLKKTLLIGTKISLAGRVELSGSRPTMTAPVWETNHQTVHTARLVPIYSETKGVSSKWLRTKIKVALNLNLKDSLPAEIVKTEKLLTYQQALKQIHFPNNYQEVKTAQKRLAFEEILSLQLAGQEKLIDWQQTHPALPLTKNKTGLNQFIKNLPFSLTDSQKKALKEILTDLEKPIAMNRLLAGDVGSGKTLVALIAAYFTYLNGQKTLFLVPTTILAQQHYQTFRQLLPAKVKINLCTAQQKELSSQDDIIIGTQALFNQKVSYRVSLVVIDEQHRFGVNQRKILVQNYPKTFPHLLTMTATPIPRSAALVFYHNLDLSLLKEKPKDQRPIKTWLIPEGKRNDAYQWIKTQINQDKAQVFVVCPLIDKSDQEMMKQVRSAKSEYEHLKKTIFSKDRLALIHGKTNQETQDKIINKFSRGQIDILVATSIVEVGLDIPQATIMIIESAERFGLAQLHQLRGRIGRSSQQAYCLLFTNSQPPSWAYQRLKILEKNQSGLSLAKLDLTLRGPGEIWGTAQHGFPQLKIANLDDQVLIDQASYWVEKLSPSPKALPRLEKRG